VTDREKVIEDLMWFFSARGVYYGLPIRRLAEDLIDTKRVDTERYLQTREMELHEL
jgi:hypothetical protein